jgi:uncharacterized membrane protein YdjX (TVP38/TMEM64 family)
VLGVVVLLLVLAATGATAPLTRVARDLVEAAGPAAPVVFALLYAVATVLLVPGAPMTALAGVLFGPALGTGVVLVGAMTGASAAFALGRWLARDRVQHLLRGRVERMDRWLTDRGFSALLVLRLVPVVPFSALNYVSGLSGIRVRDYLSATAIGIVPGTFAYVALGGTVHDPTSPAFIAAVLFFLALVGVTALLRARSARAQEAAEAPNA